MATMLSVVGGRFLKASVDRLLAALIALSLLLLLLLLLLFLTVLPQLMMHLLLKVGYGGCSF